MVKHWNNTVVPQLFKISKWEVGHPDLKVGDLCLLHQVKGKLGLQGYKYCCVDSIRIKGQQSLHSSCKILQLSLKEGKICYCGC